MGDSHARAAQRVQLMRMAQGSLQPSPRCLDHPPPGMMQLCHRESVVQFINEVPSPPPAPNPRSRRPARVPMAPLSLPPPLTRPPAPVAGVRGLWADDPDRRAGGQLL